MHKRRVHVVTIINGSYLLGSYYTYVHYTTHVLFHSNIYVTCIVLLSLSRHLSLIHELYIL